MKKKFAHLAAGTRVRIKRTPFPVALSDLPSNPREGDVVVGYHFVHFEPYRPVQLRSRRYMVRKGADGRLWLVKLRRSERPC